MHEPMNLDRLEVLLETMEPDEIRQTFAAELAQAPECLAMLATFEGLDDSLRQLKESDRPPSLPRQRIRLVPPNRPERNLIWMRWHRHVLPLAAVLVLGLLWSLEPWRPSEKQTFSETETLDTTAARPPLPQEQAPMPAEEPEPIASAEEQPEIARKGGAARPVKAKEQVQASKDDNLDSRLGAQTAQTEARQEDRVLKKAVASRQKGDRASGLVNQPATEQPDGKRGYREVESKAERTTIEEAKPPSAASADDEGNLPVERAQSMPKLAQKQLLDELVVSPNAIEEADDVSSDSAGLYAEELVVTASARDENRAPRSRAEMELWVKDFNRARREHHTRKAFFAENAEIFLPYKSWPMMKLIDGSPETNLWYVTFGNSEAYRLQLNERGLCTLLRK